MQSQPPDDHKNTLLAVILSMMVLLGWHFFYAQPQMHAQRQEQAERDKKAAAEGTVKPSTPATAAPAAESVDRPAATREEALARSPRIPIETPSLKGSIALKGGMIDDIVLAKYRETVDPESPLVVLLSPASSPKPYFVRYGWKSAAADMPVPDSETLWTASTPGPLTPTNPVTLTWNNGKGLLFKRTIAIDDRYMLTVSDAVENKTGSEVALSHFGRLFRFGPQKTAGVGILHEGLIGVPGDAGLTEISYKNALAEDGDARFDNKKGGWLGITDKYWASALIPDQTASYNAAFEGEAASGSSPDRFLVEFETQPTRIAAGETKVAESRLYAGAKQVSAVEDYEKTLGIEKFDLMIDWGWFYFITKPFAHLLNWLYGVLGNFGLAILAITVMVKLAFFPLANKSYESMAKMKKLQPQMEQLRERYKDDKARQQQELMALYQKEKINPLAGCLPILVQIPVFFALYKVLYVSIDMRHAPFYGWIHDLSAPDPTSIFNLFGLLPFAVPEFLHIGVWPVIMGITMWIQMQLNPPQPDPIQQQIFAWMPLIFTFLLASFPAGLVIYWAWNNVLSITQQWYISQKNGAEIHLFDNLRRTFEPLLRLIRRGEEPKG